jgi:hypothetical protein
MRKKHHSNPVQIQTSLKGEEDSISITNNIYLMTAEMDVPIPHDMGVDKISDDIKRILQNVRLHHTAMDEIWKCICQVDGYSPLCWQAILMKLEIPEDCISLLLHVMAHASNDRQLGTCLHCIFSVAIANDTSLS